MDADPTPLRSRLMMVSALLTFLVRALSRTIRLTGGHLTPMREGHHSKATVPVQIRGPEQALLSVRCPWVRLTVSHYLSATLDRMRTQIKAL